MLLGEGQGSVGVLVEVLGHTPGGSATPPLRRWRHRCPMMTRTTTIDAVVVVASRHPPEPTVGIHRGRWAMVAGDCLDNRFDENQFNLFDNNVNNVLH